MCEVMVKFEKRGEERGEKRGQEKERLKHLKRLIRKLKFSVKEALEFEDIPKGEWKKYERLLLE